MINIEINISSACLNAFVRIGDIELIETAFHWPLQSVVRSLEVLFCFSLPWCMVLMRRVCVHIFHCNKKKTTERKVRIEEQKHAKREDNDRFRNYSCMCVCVSMSLCIKKKRTTVLKQKKEEKKRQRKNVRYARRWFGPTTFSSLSSSMNGWNKKLFIFSFD